MSTPSLDLPTVTPTTPVTPSPVKSVSLFVRDHGRYRRAAPEDVMRTAHTLLAEHFRPGAAVLDSPERLRAFLQLKIGPLEYEVFGVIFLDNRMRLIEIRELFRGTIDSASVFNREVVKEALAVNAACVIFFHNHPSGVIDPSFADKVVTERLKQALALVDIRVLDHLIVGEAVYSFAENGRL